MITPKDILQIDATVLAGLLILLTIISIGDDSSLGTLSHQLDFEKQQAERSIQNFTNAIVKLNEDIASKSSYLEEFEKATVYFEDSDALIKEIESLENQISKKRAELLTSEIQNYVDPNPISLLNVLTLPEEILNLETRLSVFYFILDQKPGYMSEFFSTIKQELEVDLLSMQIEIEKLREEKERIADETSTSIRVLEEKIAKGESDLWNKPQGWVYYVGTPFALSAVIAILATVFEVDQNSRGYNFSRWGSLGAMGTGFVYLIVILFGIRTA